MVCQNIRCPKMKAWRCRNEATRKISVFQEPEHPKIANRWFWVYLCDPCFFSSDSSAIVTLKGKPSWKWMTPVEAGEA